MPPRTGPREERLAAHGLAGHAIKEVGGDQSTIEEAMPDA
jgi:hypothetical protein